MKQFNDILFIRLQPTTLVLILQPFRHFTYVKTHSPTLLSLYLHHSSFSNLSVTLPMSKLILQPFCRFTYITAHSPTLPLLHLHHSSFSNPPPASLTTQALHLIHLEIRPCETLIIEMSRCCLQVAGSDKTADCLRTENNALL